ncbi:MAG TPA: NAD-dependent epimerase/dehydratase family protein [Candidatus Babeliaceae bacterium]|jgi:nucleoside-diphosphate-sugar epimerase|nr:NAD-dependent epimerase/dehydratase family protein [Candidatus Babeliaceae bacterium]
MKVAITGATGFIGSYLVKRHADAGDEVRVLTRKTANDLNFNKHVVTFQGSLSDKSTIKEFVNGVDVLYHCAAEIKDEAKMQEINVTGTANLIEAAAGNIKHWVQLSSVGVYGPIHEGVVTEENKPAPNNTYEKTKFISDQSVLEAAREGKFTLTILRPSNVFGADMRNGSLFALIKSIDKGIFFFIGPKGASANYISVENVVEALVLCATNKAAIGKIYNISDWTTMEDFVKVIADVLKKPFPKFRLPLTFARLIGKIGDRVSKVPLTSGRVNALTTTSIYSNDAIVNDLNYHNIVPTKTAIQNFVIAYKNRQV